MTHLASNLNALGQTKAVELLHLKALELRTAILGKSHPDILASIAGLAITYAAQERFLEAETLETQVFEVTKKIRGLKTSRHYIGIGKTFKDTVLSG